jgi:hypothetical protein
MGLNYNDVNFLLKWRGDRQGGAVVSLGRQNVVLHPKHLRLLSKIARAGAWLDNYQRGDFADEMFRSAFGFDRIESIDISGFEGAGVVADISKPLPAELLGQFDLAVDGGTLEHVFDYPSGVANLMRLVRVGGVVYTQNPCSGLAGHGFYQFSPELMYRVFSPENGFHIEFVRIAQSRTIIVEQTVDHSVYDVADPAHVGARVNVQGGRPTMLLCLATKVADVEPFQQPPMQSDYVPRWDGSAPQLNWKGRLARDFPPFGWIVNRWKNAKAFTRVG